MVAKGWPRRLSDGLCTERDVDEHRHVDCSHYDRCLTYAIAQFDSTRRGAQHWVSWSCRDCPSHDPKPICDIEDVVDANVLEQIFYVGADLK